MNLNSVNMVGRLVRNPESAVDKNNKERCMVTIAVNHEYKYNGEVKKETCYLDMTFWDKNIATAMSLKKGDEIFVAGRLKQDKWTDQSGMERSKHTLHVNTLIHRFNLEENMSEEVHAYQQQPQSQKQQPRQQQRPAQQSGYEEYE